MIKLLFVLPVFLLLFACNTTKLAKNELKGTVTDASGLDGCGLMIKLDNGTTLQPVALPQGFTLQKDKRVKLTYTIVTGKMGICMSGSMAEITSISYL